MSNGNAVIFLGGDIVGHRGMNYVIGYNVK